MFGTKVETGKGAPLIGAVATGKESQNPKGSLCHLALQAAAREEKLFFFFMWIQPLFACTRRFEVMCEDAAEDTGFPDICPWWLK